MAVELFSENSDISPRISFSHDLCQSDVVPIEQRPLKSSSSKTSSLNSSFDFDFSFTGDDESWSADELFSGGKIVPTDIKKKPVTKTDHPIGPIRNQSDRPDPISPKTEYSSKQGKSTVVRDGTGEDEDSVTEKPNTKSFWSFKRSSSLNCGSGYGRSLCPLPLLSRSNSTGSTSTLNPKQKQSSKKQQEQMKQFRSLSTSLSNGKPNFSHQKPPLKKSYGTYGYGNGVNPVLNVGSGNLFGLSSIFSGGGRDKNRKR